MAAFEYQALQQNGKKKNGVIEADNQRHARQLLREQALMPLELHEVNEQKQAKNKRSLVRFQARISAAELALLTRQLATLVEAALPLEEALLAVAEQSEKQNTKNMMMAVRSKVVEGFSLADALKAFPTTFNHLFVAMVAAGEKSGHLDIVLNRLADYTENQQQTKSQITQAMVYPSMMVFFAFAIITALMTVVVPKIINQFDHSGVALPTITQVLIALSEFFQHYSLWLLLAIIIGISLFKLSLRDPTRQLTWHQRQLAIPLLGKLIRGLNTARFARTLSILTASAVPLLEAMRIAGDVLANQFIKTQVAAAAGKVKEGATLRAALGQTKLFPPMMMHMIASGEKSGELTDMLARAADNQDREFASLVQVGLKVLEPLLIVFMAAVVLFIVMAILLPIISLNNMVNM